MPKVGVRVSVQSERVTVKQKELQWKIKIKLSGEEMTPIYGRMFAKM